MRWRIVVVSKPPLSIEGRYAMTDTNVLHLSQPGTFADPLTEVLCNGARALLAQAVEAEVATFLSQHADELSNDGRRRLVRHGHLPEREIMTGIGPVACGSHLGCVTANCRMRSSACDTLIRLCARHVLCWPAFPLVPALRSTGSAALAPVDASAVGCSALFAGFSATMARSDFSCPCIIGYGSSPSRCGPPYLAHTRQRRPDRRYPRFRYDPFARDVALDPGRASAPRMAMPHMLPSSE